MVKKMGLDDGSKILLNDEGKPKVELEQINRSIVEQELGIKCIHVSISHEDEFSLAFVVLEKWSWNWFYLVFPEIVFMSFKMYPLEYY